MSKTRLFDAAKTLDLEAIRAILAKTPSLLDATDRQGRNILHLVCSADCKKLKVPERRKVRLFEQAYAQGAVLSEADAALLLHVADSSISAVVRTDEQARPRDASVVQAVR